MIKNFTQLKKKMKAGTAFEVTTHLNPEFVKQKRNAFLLELP